MSFLALKLANRRRYSVDDTWCMDRGMGLFAGLNVLPMTALHTSYSDRVTSAMNRRFMLEANKLWASFGYAGKTVNMDFTNIPYWGNDEHLENNFSGNRVRALGSMLAAVAQEQGIRSVMGVLQSSDERATFAEKKVWSKKIQAGHCVKAKRFPS